MGVRRGDEGQEFENVEMGESRRRREKENVGLDKSRVESEGEREESRDMVNLVSGRGGMRQRK